MKESHARSILLVKAIEESDPQGDLLPLAERYRAGRQARPGGLQGAPNYSHLLTADKPLLSSQKDYLLQRARILIQFLERRHAQILPFLRAPSFPNLHNMALYALCFLLGFLSNEIGPSGRVNILAFPLMGMIAWNLAVYAGLGIKSLAASGSIATTPPPSGLTALYSWSTRRFFLWMMRSSSVSEKLMRALDRYFRAWLSLGAKGHWARARLVLHLSACSLAMGAVAGMYVRGVGFEYQAGWSSTFLNAETVHGIVRVCLAPASLISGLTVPDLEAIRRLNWSASLAGGAARNAAVWIHLYTVTAALFVFLPRFLLALNCYFQSRRVANDFPLPSAGDPYFRELFLQDQGHGKSILILPCHCLFTAEMRERMKTLAREFAGGQAKVRLLENVEYGKEDAYLESLVQSADPVPSCLICLFNMSATPESEVQGEFVKEIQQWVREGRLAKEFLILLETSNWKSRNQGQPDFQARWNQRLNIWTSLAKSAEAEIAPLELQNEAFQPDLLEWRNKAWRPRPKTANSTDA